MGFSKKRLVILGGGSGTYTALSGLKDSPLCQLTAIVSIADSGGSSGQLRDEFGILPPGDIRQAIVALADPPIDYVALRQLFNYRFSAGAGLNGHSFGNLMLTALKEITGSEIKAIEAVSRMFRLKGSVLPVSLGKTHLCARLEDGTIIKGETNIDIRRVAPDLKILDVFLDPPVTLYPKAKREILAADWIIIGPGDLYTSLIPNLLVRGIGQTIAKSKAKIIYFCNLMTKHGETDDFAAQDFVVELSKYLGEGAKQLKYVVVNNDLKIPLAVAKRYASERSQPVRVNPKRAFPPGVVVTKAPLAAAGQLWRHDPHRLQKQVEKIIQHPA